MKPSSSQQISLFPEPSPAKQWGADATKRALAELYTSARQYRTSQSYMALMRFVGQFRFYSPFNAMLVHMQMPGAHFVATASRWKDEFGRCLKPDARLLVILRPMGPVMFVFDISEAEPEVENEESKKDTKGPKPKKKCPIPVDAQNPFGVRRGNIGMELNRTIENAKRDGIRITPRKEGSQSAGSIRRLKETGLKPLKFQTGWDRDGKPIFDHIPVRYDLLTCEKLEPPAQYATLVHELAHLYCGHLGTPNPKWWPDRRGLDHVKKEFEAESVSFLLCQRKGIDSPADEYLANYFDSNQDPPNTSLECVMKTCGFIEQMGQERMQVRKK